jgi:predicted nucleotidyltransferase
MLDIERELKLLAEHHIDCVIVGGIAARAHGSSYETSDLDICYARDPDNLNKLAIALHSVHATFRGAPSDIPFRLEAQTLRHGLNFTFDTDIGPLDLLGEVRGVGGYSHCLEGCIQIEMFGNVFKVLALDKLIVAKRTAGRPKDVAMLPELEAILEYEKIVRTLPGDRIADDIDS